MLFGKKKKIRDYLTKKQADNALTAFDVLLSDYLSGLLKERLQEMGMKKIDIHVDWMPDYKCIGIQGKVCDYYFDLQIDPETFSIAYDKDEPDDAAEYAMQDVPTFYSVVRDELQRLNKDLRLDREW